MTESKAFMLYKDLSIVFIAKGVCGDDFSKLEKLYHLAEGNGLSRIADALAENVINTPDAEILKEVEEDHGDPEYVANGMRAIIKNVIDKNDLTTDPK